MLTQKSLQIHAAIGYNICAFLPPSHLFLSRELTNWLSLPLPYDLVAQASLETEIHTT